MELTLHASPRTLLGKLNRKLRTTGKLPAVLYGKGRASLALEVGYKDFEKVFRQSGENTLVNLEIEGQGQKKVLIHDVAKHYMKDEPIHVDFYEVDLARKIHAKIPLHIVGVSPAVKELGGVLVKSLNEVEVEALPADLPQFFEVDISQLQTFQDRLHVSDLAVGEKIKILSHQEEVVILVQAPRTEAELAELEKPTAEAEKAAIEGMAAEEAKPAAEGEEAAEAAEGEKVPAAAKGEKPKAEPKAKAEESKKKEEKK